MPERCKSSSLVQEVSGEVVKNAEEKDAPHYFAPLQK